MAITTDQCIAALLGRGYFPKELPPPFQTGTLAAKVTTVSAKWTALRAAMSKKERERHPYPSHPVIFDMARKGHARRTLAIPNPVNQFYLVETIAKHWSEISALIEKSNLSVTKCEIADDGRAISLPKLSILAEKRVIAHAAQRAILQTDILSFYHSVYTHAVPWAFHGKKIAKEKRNDASLFGNQIDILLRSCRDGQTVGIPVGPDTSRIISEALLCAVELHIPEKLRKKITGGFRYIDDFFLCFSSTSDAEAILASIREACLHFDLQLNAPKTNILPVTAFNEEIWPNEISALNISGFGNSQRRSLMRFFSTVIKIGKDFPDESIASFAVRRSSKIFIHLENWDLYEAFILRMARENSNCLDSIVKLICTYAAIGYPISNAVKLFIERMIADHAPYNQHFEVAWTLWLARSLDIKLSAEASSLAFKVENDICALLALHLRSRRLANSGGLISSWLGKIDKSDLRRDHWLLIYEASQRRGWGLPEASDAVASEDFFEALRSEGVSFYDTRAYNRPLNIPGIQMRLDTALDGRKRALLPGAIMAVSRWHSAPSDLEELGADYGTDGMDLFDFPPPDHEDDE